VNKWLSTPLLYAAYTLCSVAGVVLIKHAAPLLKSALSSGGALLNPGLLVGLGATMYVAGFAVWMLILSREPLTVAYPTAVGLTMLFSSILAIVLLRESVSWSMVVGAVLVLVGIALLARSAS
jgi:multidrug transporter EmrE-like cation transporter